MESILEVEVTRSNLNEYLVFRFEEETRRHIQITKPGIYKAQAFTISGLHAWKCDENSSVFGEKATLFIYNEELTHWPGGDVREIIRQHDYCPVDAGKGIKPGKYIIYNGGLYTPKDAANLCERLYGILEVQVNPADLEYHVIFQWDVEEGKWVHITEPGTYKAHGFCVSGWTRELFQHDMRETYTKATTVYHNRQLYDLPRPDNTARRIIRNRCLSSRGKNIPLMPNKYIVFNGFLCTPRRLASVAEYLRNGR